MSNLTTKRVVTVTLNPALDLTGNVESINLGSVSLVEQSNLHAAGKGVNVAKVLCDLGAQVTVTGFLGKDNPELFQQLFCQIGAENEFVEVDGATRINVKLVESNGQVSDINFPGVHVSAQAIAQFEETLYRLAQSHDYFVFAGSLPLGVSPHQYAAWIAHLNTLGKKVLFDSSKAALRAGIEAKPWLIKPNDEELSDLVGEELTTPEQCQNAAQQLNQSGIENIVVSMGADGVMWLHQGQWLRAQPPRMEVVSTVGAGDTLVAGLCWGHMQNLEKIELLRFATALSALAVNQVGVGVTSQQELERITLETQVVKLEQAKNDNGN
ncbi:1-phosphofructokinase [Vibrio sp. JPW-9-11-11]|uniref:1-phosphofructokinase n=1 Tax=Vibrio sp. JPW-9-11-11 TaxID=1416532 RepID=UPI00159395FE|nr:1-phosphofructokinase [Vibrio sp. JPW-9-11-11]NVD07875.1 1-phosphofructokinase [Vibrio sp. JPW-9-11-11]